MAWNDHLSPLRRRVGWIGPAVALAPILAMAAPAVSPSADQPKTVALQLAGGRLRAQVAPSRGGGLASLEFKRGDRWVELLYRGKDYSETKDFAGKAPMLWPATGRNFLDADVAPGTGQLGWRLDGVAYPLTIHGFARDLPWKLERQEAGRDRARLVLTLEDSPATRRSYPFGFKLTTEYALVGGVMTIRQTVHAAAGNEKPMPFSIGNHITFNLPLVPGGEAAAVTFQTPARRQILSDKAERPTGEVGAIDFSRPTPVSALQTRVPAALGDYPTGAPWVRVLDPAGLAVTVSHVETQLPKGEPVLFNLWGDVGKGFFSPEPWVGKQNSLVTGDGLIELRPNEDFSWAITVAVDERSEP